MASAAIEPTWTTALFRPTNRLRDLFRVLYNYDSYELRNGITEVELLPDLSPEAVIATGITWEDLCRFLGDHALVWMEPGVYVCASHIFNPPGYRLFVEFELTNNDRLCVCAAREPETAAATTATCDFLVCLLTSIKRDRTYIAGYAENPIPVSGPGLSRFFQESHTKLREVTLAQMTLNEEQIRALATTEFRPTMEVILDRCNLSDDNSCHNAFVECLQLGRGPIQLIFCNINCHILAAALEGNSRVTRLVLARASATDDAERGVIFSSLAANKGLLKLNLNDHSINDENWTILCQSLKGHPTLTSLGLRFTSARRALLYRHQEDKQKAQRTRVLAAMVQENRVLLTIELERHERDDQIYKEMIKPYLETNLYRPRVLGIKKADIPLRRPLLGRALQTKSVRNKSNLLWMFLSGNQDVVFRSIE
jgi:hypothetical protein